MIHIFINNKKIACEEGEYVIDVARKNGIFISTICYLSGCSPTLACKMCMGETGDGKRVYTCNTKTKDGLVIFTETEQLKKERQEIMQTYDVNHPLECGVCDKSGECELQNLTLYTGVTHQQFALSDDEKLHKSWAQAEYDPNLCIVCERCVTTCKDNIGESKLKASKAQLHTPDSYKDSMNKDPFSVWNKKQKSLIDFVGDTPCFDCGECISVCPVGALTYKDFTYTANAWELKKTFSTCGYCSMGCQVIYEKRHFNTNGDEKIYRVTNDFSFQPICGAGRFSFNLKSTSLLSKENAVKKATEILREVKAINLGSQATNEEAYLAGILAENLNLKIYNKEAKSLQTFLNYLPLNHTLKELKKTNTIITIGANLRLNAPLLQYAINNRLKTERSAKLFYIYPFGDSVVENFSKAFTHICSNDNLTSLIALCVALNEVDSSLEETFKEFIAPILKTKVVKQIEQNGEENTEPKEEITYTGLDVDLTAFRELAKNISNSAIIIGADVLAQNINLESIAKILSLLESKLNIKVFVAPLGTNTAGIARICKLDSIDEDLKTLGIRANGDFIFDSDFGEIDSGAPSVALPSLNQIDGSICNFENKVLPLNKALDFNGIDLLDITKAILGEFKTITNIKEIAKLLPINKGFNTKVNLTNIYSQGGEDLRGYKLESKLIGLFNLDSSDNKFTPTNKFNAIISYPQNLFTRQNELDSNMQQKAGIYTSKENLESKNLQLGQTITLKVESKQIKGKVFIDYGLKGEVYAISPSLSDLAPNTYHLAELGE